jgi:hypothetical protein
MYVWRIPLPLFAALVASAALACVWIAIASLYRRVQIVVVRGVLLSIAVVAAILSPLFVHSITGNELERMAKLGVYIHCSPYLYLAPASAVTSLFFGSRLLFPRRGTTSVFRWRLRLWLIAFAFTILNIVNWCSPGWCERFGFPFPDSWWSDAIIVMNGKNLTAGTSLIAFGADISVFLLAVAALRHASRRSTTAHLAVEDATALVQTRREIP